MKRLILVCAWLIGFAMASMAQAKYVFYFIGDGMGANQVLAAEMYQAALQGKIGHIPLVMSQFPYSSQAATFSASYGITDSAATVPIFAIGVGAEHFTGWHDNSEIAPLIYQATRE
ncbi:MAG: alkaline phosphatase [Paludibacteraceae bacterium]|nr:alkaline phosphatase [Paludibacteraceae bacterium]